VAIDVEFLEPPSRSMCHLQFSPAGSVFCESQLMKLAATVGATASLHADALDLWPNEYCWQSQRCPGEIRVGLHDQVRVPVDPDLQIERDYLFAAVAGTIAAVLALGLGFLRFRRSRRLSGRQGSPAAS
jgi:hypothetical protein